MDPNIATAGVSPWRHSNLGIFIAAFFFAFQDNALLIALPWQVMNLGGKELAVGAVGMLSLGTYMAFCILTGSRFGRIGPKRLSLTSTLTTTFIIAIMPMMPSVPWLLALIGVKGMLMSMFWPPLMGWISTGLNGPELNHRLSIFNLSWSTGAILGSLLGGMLFSLAPQFAFTTSAISCFLAAVALTLTSAKVNDFTGINTDTSCETAQTPVDPHLVKLPTFQWIARVGLLLGWIAFGALRVPSASLLNEMSLDAGLHGIICSEINLIMLICFFLLGRFTRWHYNFRIITITALVLMGSLIGVGISQNAGQLLFFVFLASPVLAFIYSSHLYYSVSGSGHRQGSAALHEILLALGFSIGSFGGGAIGHSLGLRNVYFVVAGIIGLSQILQVFIYVIGTRRANLPQLFAQKEVKLESE